MGIFITYGVTEMLDAVLSNRAVHSAILFSTEGVPIDHRCYKKEVTHEPEPNTDTEGE